MAKKPDETLQQYRDRVLDSKSTSFCGAKWYNATTWLGSGTTASCHHPPAHKIPIVEVESNYTAIHNTAHKKEMLRQSQNLLESGGQIRGLRNVETNPLTESGR